MRTKPKVVSEKKREIKELEPPSDIRIHDWEKPCLDIEIYISHNVVEKILEHCCSLGEKRLEAMGFLVGDVHKWKGKEYTVVQDIVTSELDTTTVSVKFKRDAFEPLFLELDKIPYDYVLVGWYHSHPGHACFMSTTDIATQKKMFNKNFHVAVVVDPINREMKAYKLTETHYEEKVYAVYGAPEELPSEEIKAEVKAEKIEREEVITYDAEVLPDEPKKQLSPAIFILPFLFGILGGIIGTIAVWEKNKGVGALLIILGILMTIVWCLLSPFILVWEI
ncbi:MAG: Mov34/MPN/PAD-1 family protein [Candidatus Thermoplasmatota archaeon]